MWVTLKNLENDSEESVNAISRGGVEKGSAISILLVLHMLRYFG